MAGFLRAATAMRAQLLRWKMIVITCSLLLWEALVPMHVSAESIIPEARMAMGLSMVTSYRLPLPAAVLIEEWLVCVTRINAQTESSGKKGKARKATGKGNLQACVVSPRLRLRGGGDSDSGPTLADHFGNGMKDMPLDERITPMDESMKGGMTFEEDVGQTAQKKEGPDEGSWTSEDDDTENDSFAGCPEMEMKFDGHCRESPWEVRFSHKTLIFPG